MCSNGDTEISTSQEDFRMNYITHRRIEGLLDEDYSTNQRDHRRKYLYSDSDDGAMSTDEEMQQAKLEYWASYEDHGVSSNHDTVWNSHGSSGDHESDTPLVNGNDNGDNRSINASVPTEEHDHVSDGGSDRSSRPTVTYEPEGHTEDFGISLDDLNDGIVSLQDSLAIPHGEAEVQPELGSADGTNGDGNTGTPPPPLHDHAIPDCDFCTGVTYNRICKICATRSCNSCRTFGFSCECYYIDKGAASGICCKFYGAQNPYVHKLSKDLQYEAACAWVIDNNNGMTSTASVAVEVDRDESNKTPAASVTAGVDFGCEKTGAASVAANVDFGKEKTAAASDVAEVESGLHLIKFRNEQDEIVNGWTRWSAPLQEAMKLYCEGQNLNQSATRFFVDGQRIAPLDTLEIIGIEKGGVIEVTMQQDGGAGGGTRGRYWGGAAAADEAAEARAEAVAAADEAVVAAGDAAAAADAAADAGDHEDAVAAAAGTRSGAVVAALRAQESAAKAANSQEARQILLCQLGLMSIVMSDPILWDVLRPDLMGGDDEVIMDALSAASHRHVTENWESLQHLPEFWRRVRERQAWQEQMQILNTARAEEAEAAAAAEIPVTSPPMVLTPPSSQHEQDCTCRYCRHHRCIEEHEQPCQCDDCLPHRDECRCIACGPGEIIPPGLGVSHTSTRG